MLAPFILKSRHRVLKVRSDRAAVCKHKPPSVVEHVAEKRPDVWNAHNQLAQAVGATLAPALAGLFVGQTFRLSLGQSFLFYQQALQLVSFSGATPFAGTNS